MRTTAGPGFWLTVFAASSTIDRSKRCELRHARRHRASSSANLEGGAVRLLIAIPVFNERGYVQRVLGKVKPFAKEILCIDDGSSDGTGELLESLAAGGEIRLVRHARNRGYGQSIIDAFDYAHEHGFDWVITMDCDEQHEPERIPEFLREIKTGKWDLISGSRYMQPRQDDDLPPGDRRAINATITATLNALFNCRLTDAFCGFKAHRTSAVKRLRLTETGYAFPLQFWPRVQRFGLRFTEIPVRLIYNDPTRHFGGQLDDASRRLSHYMDVLHREMELGRQEIVEPAVSESEPQCCCCCE
jgi:dolichol-phosphate mannosyltransferase